MNQNLYILLRCIIITCVVLTFSGCTPVERSLPESEFIDVNLDPPELAPEVLAEIPPTIHTLDIDGQRYNIAPGQTQEVVVGGKPTLITLEASVTRTFEKLGVEFQYNADMTFALTCPDSSRPQWKLSGTWVDMRFAGFWNVSKEAVEGVLDPFLKE